MRLSFTLQFHEEILDPLFPLLRKPFQILWSEKQSFTFSHNLMPLSTSVTSLKIAGCWKTCWKWNYAVKRKELKPWGQLCLGKGSPWFHSPDCLALYWQAALSCCAPGSPLPQMRKQNVMGVTSNESVTTGNNCDIKCTKNDIMRITYLVFLCLLLFNNFWELIMLQLCQTWNTFRFINKEMICGLHIQW